MYLVEKYFHQIDFYGALFLFIQPAIIFLTKIV